MSDVVGALCDLCDDLARLTPQGQPAAVRCTLEALVDRLDLIIDDVVGLAVPALEDAHDA